MRKMVRISLAACSRGNVDRKGAIRPASSFGLTIVAPALFTISCGIRTAPDAGETTLAYDFSTGVVAWAA